MKKILLLVILSVGLMGCNVVYNDDATEPESSVKTKDVQFVIKGIDVDYQSVELAPSRVSPRMDATITSEGMTDLWLYEGTTLLKHQVSTDADFGTPTVSITYGSHDITFVASKADGQTFSTVWNCTKVRDTFAKQMNITVSGNSSTSRQVELSRRIGQVAFTIEDAIPATVKTLHLTAQNHLSLDASLVGGTATTYEASVDISSRQGQTGYAPTINLLTASATDAEDCDVMIEFKAADGTILYHYERTVSVKPNRCTRLTGNYFAGESNAVSLLTTWDDELEIAL